MNIIFVCLLSARSPPSREGNSAKPGDFKIKFFKTFPKTFQKALLQFTREVGIASARKREHGLQSKSSIIENFKKSEFIEKGFTFKI